MSDFSQGPNWWQASDGKWYPPAEEQATSPRPSSPQPNGPAAEPVNAKGFVKSLFDFKFDHFVAPSLIRFFYAFLVIVLSVFAVIGFIGMLSQGGGSAVAAIFLWPLLYFACLIGARINFELVAIRFRMADDLRAIRRSNGA